MKKFFKLTLFVPLLFLITDSVKVYILRKSGHKAVNILPCAFILCFSFFIKQHGLKFFAFFCLKVFYNLLLEFVVSPHVSLQLSGLGMFSGYSILVFLMFFSPLFFFLIVKTVITIKETISPSCCSCKLLLILILSLLYKSVSCKNVAYKRN